MPQVKLPEFPGDLRPLEELEDRSLDPETYGDVDDVLVRADRLGVVDVPAENARSARAGTANRVREPVLAEWLWLLGYRSRAEMPASRSPDELRALTDSVRAFQAGAGLKRHDGWAGEVTWKAMRELVTFEMPTGVRKYFSPEGEPRPALVRAIRLRLYALGLLKAKPTAAAASDRVPQAALRAFWRMLWRLGMAEDWTAPPPLPELVEILFDHDRLLEGAARSSAKRSPRASRLSFKLRRLATEDKQTIQAEVRSYLVRILKIELWLLGLDVDINGASNYPVYGFEPDGAVQPHPEIKQALQQFWATVGGIPRLKKKLFLRRVTPELMRVLANPETLGRARTRPVTAGDYSLEISKTLKTNRKIAGAWSKGKSLGMRLWDGLRRLWRWLKRGIKKILQLGLNLIRGFFRYAVKAYEIVRFASRTVAAAVKQYFGGRIRTGEGNRVRALLAGDGDLRLVVPAGSSPEMIGRARDSVAYFGDAFYFATRILSWFVRVVVTLAKAVAGVTTKWARLLWILVRSYRELRPLYRELRDRRTPGSVRPLYA